MIVLFFLDITVEFSIITHLFLIYIGTHCRNVFVKVLRWAVTHETYAV